jgi:hypothetical protein
VIDQAKEVKKMFSKTSLRRMFAAGFVLGVLAMASPAASLAANVGGGPIATG